MNLQENERNKIIFGLNLLLGINNNGYKLKSINIKEDVIFFSNGEKDEKISIKKIMENIPKVVDTEDENSEIINSDIELTSTSDIVKEARGQNNLKQILSETSDLPNQNGGYETSFFSETSEMSKMSEMSEMSEISKSFTESNKKIVGGSKNIFQKSKLSETSSVKMSEMSNYSKTSSAVFNERTDKYSDTSVIGQIGGKLNETTDTLMDLSELKQRKNPKSSNLDMGIFKKNQSGGSADSVRRKMMDVGINSNSSTSSICE